MDRRKFIASAVAVVASPMIGSQQSQAWELDNMCWGVFKPNGKDSHELQYGDPKPYAIGEPVAIIPPEDYDCVKWAYDYAESRKTAESEESRPWPKNWDAFKKHIQTYWKHRLPAMDKHFKTYEEFEASFRCKPSSRPERESKKAIGSLSEMTAEPTEQLGIHTEADNSWRIASCAVQPDQ